MNNTIKGDWMTVNPPDKKGKRVPIWARSLFVSTERKVYLPAALFGNENAIFFCVSFDGDSGVIYSKNHLYVQWDWLKKEYSKKLGKEILGLQNKVEEALELYDRDRRETRRI
jgi:hypothetical protein